MEAEGGRAAVKSLWGWGGKGGIKESISGLGLARRPRLDLGRDLVSSLDSLTSRISF